MDRGMPGHQEKSCNFLEDSSREQENR